MAQLSIVLLGAFQVTKDGQAITKFESDKVRALLTYLVVEADRPHQRQFLAGLLWPDYAERSARASLRNALANLRQVIDDKQATPPFLHISRQDIQFNQASVYEVDVERLGFKDADIQASQRLENMADLREAVDLYQGPFLAGFSLPDSPTFEEWALLKREFYHRKILSILQTLSNYYQSEQDYPLALFYARRYLSLEPWAETLHQQVMRLLLLSGQRNEALKQYEICRNILKTELGLDPSPETIRLYQEIRQRTTQNAELAPIIPPSPAHNLPHQFTPFIGRGVELAELHAHLKPGGPRLISIIGPGGSGKTRLAVEAALTQLTNFQDGVFFGAFGPASTN